MNLCNEPMDCGVFRERAKKCGHPAAFPKELPKRCIKLFSFIDDLILDPFVGSGTTLVSAMKLNRRAIRVEMSEKYCKIANQRIQSTVKELYLQQSNPDQIKRR
ncbi:MAG: site-specific DNA-methyltransferase [Thermodesulfovibrio sp.]|nr:site-specific DNA-methyltransferase [Thermodesulfovibrio sp.]